TFHGVSFHFLIEEIRRRSGMCCPDEALLMFRQIARKGRNTLWFQPNTSVCHFYLREDVCGRELFLQTLCCLIIIWRERSDVDECGDTVVRSSGGDDRAPVGAGDKDCGLPDSTQSSLDINDISTMRVQTVPRRDYLEPLLL